MRIVFMGTPDFSVPVLGRLQDSNHKVALVVTRPDRPRGRGLRLTPPPVKKAALDLSLPVFQPPQLDSDETKSRFLSVDPDAVVVAAYGRIIPPWLLNLPKHGCLNIHPSLLPRHRGPAPIQRAVMAGEKETGVSIIVLDEGMDTGDILLQRNAVIGDEETAGDLAAKLASMSSELLIEVLDGLESGTLGAREQGETGVSYAPKIEKGEAVVEWNRPASEILNLVRGLNPVPGAHTRLHHRRLKIWLTALEELQDMGIAGSIVVTDEPSGPVVATGDGGIRLLEVQVEGKERVSGAEFVRGYQVKVGERLGGV